MINYTIIFFNFRRLSGTARVAQIHRKGRFWKKQYKSNRCHIDLCLGLIIMLASNVRRICTEAPGRK